VRRKEPPRHIRAKLLKDLQSTLVAQGIEIEWPRLSPR
jgi:hypothetical protein